ncbi:hypothetical protein JTE90_018535 [Oedothorax gibbosus]|uniref:E3 ubiquitin-protein ligase NRDP1 n=1 Tax=Oedothorax gibbosus TaxID=931172 RepID=A0AAV6V549_9ARAC|nr:hypothetical protein JTE90_018535 [Oedothorax gibbosus]
MQNNWLKMSENLGFFPTRIFLYWLLVLHLILIYFATIAQSGIIIYDGEENIEEFSDSELPFAQPIAKYGLEGAIVSADPVDACTKIASPPNITDINWFVLIAGNFCDYNTKLRNSAYAGYSAAIIYSLRGRDDRPVVQHHDFIANISGVTIRTSSGLIIKDNYLHSIDPRFGISLRSNNIDTNWHFSIKKYTMLFVAIGFFAVFLTVPLGIVRFVHQTHTFHESCLSTEHLRQLQTSRFQKGDPYETCAICLEDYKTRDKLRILPCSHGYHASCIDPWLTRNRRICPVCKQRVVLANEFSDIESDVHRSETAPLLNRNVPSFSYRAMSDNDNASSYSHNSIISETPRNSLIAVLHLGQNKDFRFLKMGYDITRFEGEVDEDLICPICSGVLEEPLHAPQCEHAFCKSCINEWLTRQPSCPVDRQPITTNELKPVPRIMRNLLSRLMIMCDNANFGCTTVVKLERLEVHKEECEHNPKRPVPCEQGCGLVVPKDELKEHNCVREVRLMLQTQQHRINEMQCAINEMRRDIVLMKSCMQECIRAVRLSNPSIPAVVEEVDDTIRWANSLQRARVTRWGGMISTPDSVLQTMVRRALSESGCPAHVTAELMENAHERRWPTGLSTLETRQSNRRYYENYVCKRIPGKQAVVVMAVDNSHMNDDMVLDPGLVMIFAHGIE